MHVDLQVLDEISDDCLDKAIAVVNIFTEAIAIDNNCLGIDTTVREALAA